MVLADTVVCSKFDGPLTKYYVFYDKQEVLKTTCCCCVENATSKTALICRHCDV